MMTKAELEGVLTRMALGEREAFDQIYEATSATLFGLCLHILEDSAAAEEALLEAYTTIWRLADRARADGADPATWLTRTTRSVAIERRAARLATSGRKDAGRTPDAAGTGPDIPAPPQIKSRLDKALFNHRSIGETLLRWAVGAMLGAAAAASVAFVALNYAIPIINQAVLTAVVEGQAGVTLSARYESFSGELTVARIAGAPEPGRSHELWLIPPGAAPVSLGVLDAQGRAVVDLSSAAPEALLGAVLGVSSAPQGGSATGAPSGAFLAAGALTLLQ